MGVISKDNNQIQLYYSSDSTIGKQTYGYVKAAEKEVLAIDVSNTQMTGTQWAEIAKGLDVPIRDLINTQHATFQKEYGEQVDLEAHDWLKILEKHPETLVCPILIIGEAFHAIKNPSTIANYLEPDSAGLEKPYNKDK